jgi:hypothetical protein
MSWYENLLINPLYLIILLVILTLIGIFIVQNTSISDKQCREDDFFRYWALILSLLAVHLTAISRSFYRYQPFAEPLLALRRGTIGVFKKAIIRRHAGPQSADSCWW